MRGTRDNVLKTAILVAKAGCAGVRKQVRMASVVTALGLMLGLGGCASTHGTSGIDRDGDGYESDVDCNDEDPNIYPGAPESFPVDCCDTPSPGVDMDCDGVPVVCTCNPIPDYDGDGYPGWEDCNDNDPTIYPGAPEDPCAADGIDRDCDGNPPGLACNPMPDADGDGFPQWEDCDDSDPNIHPGADEPVCPDGADQDCDGMDGVPDPTIRCASPDADGDGYPVYYDCDDSDPNINPGVEESDDSCADGIDQNCDGLDNGFICNGMADAESDASWG